VKRKQVLYLTHRVPYPPDKGDRIRTYHTLRFLAKRADVHLACLADEPVSGAATAALHMLCRRVEIVAVNRVGSMTRAAASLAMGRTASEGAFRSSALSRVIESWMREVEFHVALASASSIAPYLRSPFLRDIRTVVDLMDIDSQKWLDYAGAARGVKSLLYRLEARRLRRLELELANWVRGIVVVSDAEADIYRSFCATGPLHAISNGVDLQYFQAQAPSSGRRLVFVGALDYKPNIDAANWFCTSIWPQVRARYPAASIQLVGRRPAPAVRRLAALAGVEVVGTVPDVRPYVRDAAAVVAPLRLGRGLQNKVLESLAMARPTVASPVALAGIRARPEEHLLMADTPESWVRQLGKLFGDDGLRQQLGQAGRAFVEEHHDWERCLMPLAALLGIDEPAGESDTVGADLPTGESRLHESLV
jgi:sugar transferase (PEP-CTERM/EpsH1 system associated)